jgi:hypothetical protein
MATLIYNRTLRLDVVACCACGIEYGIPEELNKQLLNKTHTATTYCPNGHGWHYAGMSDAERARRAEARATHADDQRRAAERQAAAYRGQVTKLRKRVGNGVCPCCNRTFANLARHMTGQHPGWEARDG